MAYLNVNVPPTYAQIRREYLYDLKKHHGEVEDCIIFGLSALTGRAILFHAIMENGAIFYRLPISAFIQKGFDEISDFSRSSINTKMPLTQDICFNGKKDLEGFHVIIPV